MATSPTVPRVTGWLDSINKLEPQGGGIVYDCRIKYKVDNVVYILKESVNTNSFHDKDSVAVKYMPHNPKIATIRTLPDIVIDILIFIAIGVLVIATFVKNWT